MSGVRLKFLKNRGAIMTLPGGERHRLQGRECDVLVALMCHQRLAPAEMLAIMYPVEIYADVPQPKVFNLWVHRLRGKLSGSGVVIRTFGQSGYRLAVE